MKSHKVFARIFNSPNVTTWTSLLARTGGALLVIPLALHHLPPSDFALWLLFMTVAGLQLLVDFGFSQTFSRQVSYAATGAGMSGEYQPGLAASQRTTEIRANLAATLHAMAFVYRYLAIIAFVLLISVGSWAVSGLIAKSTVGDSAWIAWFIVAGSTALGLYGNRYTAYLTGINRIAQQKRGESVITAGTMFCQIFALQWHASVLGLVLVNQLGMILQVLVNRRLLLTDIRQTVPDASNPLLAGSALRYAWQSAWRSAVGISLGFGAMQISTVIIANALPVSQAASFLLGVRIMQLISQFSQVPFYTKLPILAGFRARGESGLLESHAQKYMLISYLLFVLGFGIMAALGDSVLRLIQSKSGFPDSYFWLLLGVGVLVERFGAMHLQLYSTTNTILWHKANGLFSIVFIPFLVILLPRFGAVSYALALLGANLLAYAPYSAFHSHRVLSARYWDFEKRCSLVPALLMLTFCLLIVTNHA